MTMELNRIEKKVAEIAAKMGLSYICETWTRANVVLDRFRRDTSDPKRPVRDNKNELALPVCLYVQPVAGSLKFDNLGMCKDAPVCSVSFGDAMPFDYHGDVAQEIAERLKSTAAAFIVECNKSGFFEPISGDVRYQIAFDRMDANLCFVTLQLTLVESVGVCAD